MYRAVLTLLVGLMLSLSGGAGALTFKSDGSVVQNDGTKINSSDRPAEVPDLSKYDEFRVIDFDVAGKKYSTHTAFSQGKTLFGFKAKGVLVYQAEFCEWQSVIRNSKTKTGSFEAECPSGAKVDGEFTFVGNHAGSYGAGIDNSGRKVSYSLKGRGSSSKAEVRKFFEQTRSVDADGAAQVVKNASVKPKKRRFLYLNDSDVCALSVKRTSSGPVWSIEASEMVEEAKRRGLSCGVAGSASAKGGTNSPTNAELEAAQKRAAELEKQLALLQAKEELNQRQIASDNQAPFITIIQSGANGREGYLTGSVTDNVGIAEVLVDGAPVSVAANGSFEWTGFVPATGKEIIVEAIDTAALSSRQVVRLERGKIEQAIGPTFDDLNPMAGKRVLQNKNALALIVGISDYERTDAPAIYADKDAQYFHDYASLKLGIPDQNITTLVNDKAEQGDVFLAVADWMRRSSKPGKSDVYIFFAGHGLASQDGEQMYLLPYDGRPRLLDKTAILRDELFADIAAANPRSVTVFLDTCYSGTTRGPDMLIASRPIAIRAKEQSVPEGFTVMTAAAGDQTAKPLEEAKHGMFSYFLMKGMEGDADANQDNQITAGELQEYVYQNVVQQSSGSQTPELQGDADRVLVRFQ